MQVGFIGVGGMGAAMALRLLKANHEVLIWNRSPEPAERLAEQGAVRVETPEDALQADVLINMLATDEAISAVLLQPNLLRRARPGLVHVVMATVSVDFAKHLEKIHGDLRDLRLGYVAAPVLGRPDAAAAGKLHVLAGGDPALIAHVQPLFDAMAQATWAVGAQPHYANVAKLAVNFLLASAIEGMSEAIAFARRQNVDADKLIEILTGTLFAAPAYKVYGPAILDGKFEAGFKLLLGLKDIRLVLAAAENATTPMPFASILRDNFVDAIAHGDGDKDWAALSKVALRRAGLTPS